MRYTVSLHGLHGHFGGDIGAVVGVAALADELGLHAVSLPDHVAMGTRTDLYPYGQFPLPETYPWYEPMTVLAAVAQGTRRIRLTTSVLISPLRPAVLLAKIAATLDCLSAGRFELGAGVGWQREEFDAVGVPFEKRAARLIDGLRACRTLWSGERRSFESPTVAFSDLRSLPAPVGGIPLWLGMKPTPRVREWMAELDAGWVAMAVDAAAIAADVAAIRESFAKAGRDSGALRVRAGLPVRIGADRRPDLAATLEGSTAAAAAGVTDIEIFLGAFARSPADLENALRTIAAA